MEIKKKPTPAGRPLDGIPFHPYYTVHDIFGVAVFLIIFCAVVFFAPEMGGYFLEYNNFIPADPLKTPPHIAPVWYFTPFYSILRATTDQFMAVLAVGTIALSALILLSVRNPILRGAIAVGTAAAAAGVLHARREVLGRGADGRRGDDLLPALARPVAGQVDPLSARLAFLVAGRLVVAFVVLGYLGTQPPSAAGQYISMAGTVVVLRLLPADAVVEPHGVVQAGSRPRHVHPH